MAIHRVDAVCRSAAALLVAVSFAVGCGKGDRSQTEAGPPAEPSNTAAAEEKGNVPDENATPAGSEGVASPSPGENAPQATTASEATPKRTTREPIYDEAADGATLIAAALERARSDRKHLLIEWGGNWCGWCYKLHDMFTKDETVRPLVLEEFELVLLDSGTNRELMEQHGWEDRQFSYPHLTVLDVAGNVLTNQNTEPLEVGSHHDPAKVAEFLRRWSPERDDAESLITAALRKAADEDKRVLLHVGTPYCGWCKVLSRFLHERESLFAADYVDLKIDTLRMANGEAVAGRFQPGDSPGVPWMVILDASGEGLASSVGPEGNCGYPYSPAEIDHFMSMISATHRRMTDADLAAIRSDLNRYREEREKKDQEVAKVGAATEG